MPRPHLPIRTHSPSILQFHHYSYTNPRLPSITLATSSSNILPLHLPPLSVRSSSASFGSEAPSCLYPPHTSSTHQAVWVNVHDAAPSDIHHAILDHRRPGHQVRVLAEHQQCLQRQCQPQRGLDQDLRSGRAPQDTEPHCATQLP